MSDRGRWLFDAGGPQAGSPVDGLVFVEGFRSLKLTPDQYVIMEKANSYGATAVFFGAGRNGATFPQAFIYDSDGPANDPTFGERHRQLWSWGGVPLVYRRTPGLVQLFRCAHGPDFEAPNGALACRPFKTLKQTAAIDTALKKNAAWWDAEMLRNGTLWDDAEACKGLLSSRKSAHKTLIDEIKALNEQLNKEGILPKPLRRKLLILSLLIAYLEARKALTPDDFGKHLEGADKFFQVLADGPALVSLLEALETRFNGKVFSLLDEDRERLRTSCQLVRFARLVKARQEKSGQLTLWQRYSFRDLPVELISHIYQLFVKDSDSSVYTPPFLVRLMLDEAMSWDRLDWLEEQEAVVLDPSCGSGVFLVEAYKRLVTHWRLRHDWKKPGIPVLKSLLNKIHGIDLEAGAVELAAFSLCLALCDALQPEEIRQSVKLFPELMGKTIQESCFFEAKEKGNLESAVGIVVGNPPFESSLTTEGAQRAYDRYVKKHGDLPDKQLAYLFLHEAMEAVAPGGVLSLLQQYNFLYNQQSLGFRRQFIQRWDVREILDFISVRGLFHKGGADTKVIVVVAESQPPPPERQILHATFRRSIRADAEQGFDIDYYDMHWLPRGLALSNDSVWRSNLLGGGNVLGFVDRLKKFSTLGQYAEAQRWDYGEGFIEGGRGVDRPAEHIVGHKCLPSEALSCDGIDESLIKYFPAKPIEGPRSKRRFTPPMLLIREQMDLPAVIWARHYLVYKNKIVGFAAPPSDLESLSRVDSWIRTNRAALCAYVAGISVRLFTQKATTLSEADIISLPYPESGTLDISPGERILVDDIVGLYRDLIRLGEKSRAMSDSAADSLTPFNETFTSQINGIYRRKPLRVLPAQTWPGVICQPYIFGKGSVEWDGADELKEKLDGLLREQRGTSLHITRIARIYDGHAIYLLKPDRLRYWLRSIALRDADETLADLAEQGF